MDARKSWNQSKPLAAITNMQSTRPKVVIIDYGIGNLGSVRNMLKKCGVNVVCSCNPADIKAADKLILSGVGAFDAAIDKLDKCGVLSDLEEKVLGECIPLLGICVGMQILTRGSEEGSKSGLGWLDAEVIRFKKTSFPPTERVLRIPHMGWNGVQPTQSSFLFQGFEGRPRFYFVHSYHLVCDYTDAIALTWYGYDFVSAIQNGNIMGVQFHPEKSHKYGYTLLRNFVEQRDATTRDSCVASR